MKSAALFSRIKSDRTYLLRVYCVELVVFGVLSVFAAVLPDLRLPLPLLLSLAPVVGLLLASLIHNASHNNIRGEFLNRCVGEFCGAWALYGFTNFVMIHLLHHRYSDTDFDPVNPKGKSFLIFLLAPMRFMIKVAIQWLEGVHGHKRGYREILLTQTVVFHLVLGVKLCFWWALFGTEGFLFFYLPALFTLYGVHAHINYVCHRELADGSVEIFNLNHNPYYKLVNFVTSGGYFHRNHHENLKLFNPQRLRTRTITGV